MFLFYFVGWLPQMISCNVVVFFIPFFQFTACLGSDSVLLNLFLFVFWPLWWCLNQIKVFCGVGFENSWPWILVLLEMVKVDLFFSGTEVLYLQSIVNNTTLFFMLVLAGRRIFRMALTPFSRVKRTASPTPISSRDSMSLSCGVMPEVPLSLSEAGIRRQLCQKQQGLVQR